MFLKIASVREDIISGHHAYYLLMWK